METKRLLLRAWKESDVKQLYQLAKDPRVGLDCGWNPHKNLEESAFVLQNILMVKETYAIVLKETSEVIGNISIFTSNYCTSEREKEIGFWLGYPYWGNGYMTEACEKIIDYCFDELKLETIWCGHFSYNDKSKRVQEKCGFEFHHIDEHHYLPQLDKEVIGIVNYITRSHKKTALDLF